MMKWWACMSCHNLRQQPRYSNFCLLLKLFLLASIIGSTSSMNFRSIPRKTIASIFSRPYPFHRACRTIGRI